jgi:hypothetical protein
MRCLPLDVVHLTKFCMTCSESPKATGVESYSGYIGPFKAHPGSVDMVSMAPAGGMLWNAFPAGGNDMADAPIPSPSGPDGEEMCMCPCSCSGGYGAYGGYGGYGV